MRIVTWNCCRRSYESAMLALGRLKADLVLLQEVGKPVESGSCVAWAGTHPRQGTLIGVFNGTLASTGSTFLPFGAASVTVHGSSPFVVLNIWAQKAPSYVGHVNATLDQFRDTLSAGPCVIAGDFNSEGPQDATRRPSRHVRLVERLRDEFGLVSAYHHAHKVAHGAEKHATYYHQRHRDEPWHIDYCFVPHQWIENSIRVRVLTREPWRSLSDHRPVVVDVVER